MNTYKHESSVTASKMKQLRKIMIKVHLCGIRNYGIRQQLNEEAIGRRKSKRMLN